MDLIWDNCIKFNGPQSPVGVQATTLQAFANKKFAQENVPDEAPILAAPIPGQRAAPKGRTSGAADGGRGSKRGRESANGAGGGAIPVPTAVPDPSDAEIQLIPSSDVLLSMKTCKSLLLPLMSMPNADFFLKPVDHVALNLPDYPTIIKKPMDLGTIEKKLEARSYSNPGEFVDDIRLVWANARRYNPAGTIVHGAATHFRNIFERNLHMQVNPGVTPPAAVMAAAAAPAPSLQWQPSAAAAAPPAPPKAAAPPPAAPAPRPAPPPPVPSAQPPPAAAPPATAAEPKAASFPVSAPKPSAPSSASGCNGAAASSAYAAAPAQASHYEAEAQGAEYVSQVYMKVIRVLRQQHAAKYFKEPVDWQKLKLWNYLEVVTQPMDLLTVLRKLERREYPDVASLRKDVDLIWDNAVLYNGESSWIKKYVDTMRTIASRKFADVAARARGSCASRASRGQACHRGPIAASATCLQWRAAPTLSRRRCACSCLRTRSSSRTRRGSTSCAWRSSSAQPQSRPSPTVASRRSTSMPSTPSPSSGSTCMCADALHEAKAQAAETPGFAATH